MFVTETLTNKSYIGIYIYWSHEDEQINLFKTNSTYKETLWLTCKANLLTSFYMMETLPSYGLIGCWYSPQ